MRSPSDPLGPIHWIADLDVAGSPEALVAAARRLLPVGLPSLQLRGKGWSTDDLVAAGGELRALAAEAGALFVVNGDRAAAERLDADGLHLPASTPAAPASGPRAPGLRRGTAGAMLVGHSVHDAAELERAAGADWVFVSPVFPTLSKPGAAALGLEGLESLVRRSEAPVWALGGITAANAATCRPTGAVGVAAIRALLSPDGPRFVEDVIAAAERSDRGVRGD